MISIVYIATKTFFYLITLWYSRKLVLTLQIVFKSVSVKISPLLVSKSAIDIIPAFSIWGSRDNGLILQYYTRWVMTSPFCDCQVPVLEHSNYLKFLPKTYIPFF